MDKLTPCSQKGYSSTRRCQEVLIDIIEGINECKAKNKKGALLSLDIKKAFDTIGHSFIERVLDFFNFGPLFKKWLLLLCTKRRAAIILESGISGYFELKRGNAQGDIISPFLFLLGYQILLFKLQFDLQIIGIIEPVVLPADCPPLPAEVRNIPVKVLAMADDANCLVEMSRDTLLKIKNVLADFGLLSGLECNIEKTALIPIGSTPPIEASILELGFDIKNSAIILGVEISNNDTVTDKAVQKVLNNIKKEINYWTRFRLSLPGRINVAKSMLYSQVNYTGTFLPFTNIHLSDIQKLIENFVKGNLNIAKSRVFTSKNNGGLGLCDLTTFLQYQKCSWLKLALKLDDTWKIRLYEKSKGNILNTRSIWLENYPVLSGICKALDLLREKFTLQHENFRESAIFENRCINRGRRLGNTFNSVFFGLGDDRHRVIENLTVRDFLNGENLVPIELVNISTGININLDQYRHIVQSINTLRTRAGERDDNNGSCTTIVQIFSKYKKGSKIFKNVIIKNDYEYIPHNIVKYQTNTNCVINIKGSKWLNGLWGCNFLDNSTRTFCFKLHNNTLGYNYLVNKFVRNHSSLCTFCRLARNPEGERETPFHIFYSCPSVEIVFNSFFQNVLGLESFNTFTLSNYFGILTTENNNFNYCMMIICLLFKKYIWLCKLREILPAPDKAKWFVRDRIQVMSDCNIRFKTSWQSANINLFF